VRTAFPPVIDSILRQTYRAFEILAVDDGSMDGTAELIAGRHEHDPRVRYHRRTNGGVLGARNTAIELDKGGALVFCDSDDPWVDYRLILQMATFPRLSGYGSRLDRRFSGRSDRQGAARWFATFLPTSAKRRAQRLSTRQTSSTARPAVRPQP